MTVNNQIVVGTLMNLADNPTRVSIGQDWRESDITKRIPIIFTGNDFSTLYAPLIRDGRMEKFYWYILFSNFLTFPSTNHLTTPTSWMLLFIDALHARIEETSLLQSYEEVL